MTPKEIDTFRCPEDLWAESEGFIKIWRKKKKGSTGAFYGNKTKINKAGAARGAESPSRSMKRVILSVTETRARVKIAATIL